MRLKNCTNQRKCAIIWLIITISLAFQYYASHNSFLRKISSSTNEVNLKETLVQVTTKYLNKKQQINASKKLTSIHLSNSSDFTLKTNKEGKIIQTKEKIILYWDVPYREQIKVSKNVDKSCGNCIISTNRSLISNNMTSAVVFSFDKMRKDKMPENRNWKQLYVFYFVEPPPILTYRKTNLTKYENIFNLTMTYRRDSDVYWPYEKMSDILHNLQTKYRHTNDVGIDEIIKSKTKFALWIVSNCGILNGAKTRYKISEELIASGLGSKLDRRGGCFPEHPVSRKTQNDLIEKYKFYLAFENSYHCRDYITEKLFRNGFLSNTLPVVWGAKKSDYEAVIPPKSCIFVDDFKTIKDLTDYLLYLDKNETAYREYFQWRKMKVSEMPGFEQVTKICQLCRIINQLDSFNDDSNQMMRNNKKKYTISSLSDFYFKTENKECV